MFEDRKYLIIPASEIKKVDFTKVMESSADHLVYSFNKKKTFIKWEGEEPDFIKELKNTEGPYTNEEIREIMKDDKWKSPGAEA